MNDVRNGSVSSLLCRREETHQEGFLRSAPLFCMQNYIVQADMTLTNDTITNKYRSLKYIYQYKNVFDKPDEQSQTCLNCHGEKTWA